MRFYSRRIVLVWWCIVTAAIVAAADGGNDEDESKSSKSAKDYYVWDLPGLDRSTTKFHKMHAGNIVIKPEHHGSLFFWSFDAEYIVDRPRTLLWLNGGPGCSSMDGALMEVGPYRIDKDKVIDNVGSWGKFSNLLFVDQPLGTGFSNVDTDSYIHELDEMAKDMMTFLEKYYEIFPDRLQDELYIGGESFAGQYIPYIARAVQQYNEDKSQSSDKKIDLKGLLIGNGWVDPAQHYLSYVPFAYQHGLLKQGSKTANEIESMQRNCLDKMEDMGTNLTIHVDACERVVNAIVQSVGDENSCMNIYDIRKTDSSPACGMNWPPDLEYIDPYLRQEKVLRALNTYSEANAGWRECSGSVGSAFSADHSRPSVELLPDLAKEMPILFFNGDQDFVCNHLGNEKLLEKLEWNGERGFGDVKPQKWQGGEVTSARNITYAKVAGGSHMLPFDLPETSQFMFNAFIGLTAWDGSHNITNVSGDVQDKVEKEKAVSDATWKAYYRAGSVALVVLLIVLGCIGFVLWRNQRHATQYLGSGEESGGLFSSFINGLARWKPSSRSRGASANRSSSGSYTTLNPRRQRQVSSSPDVILEEEEYEIESGLSSPTAKPSRSERQSIDN